MPESAQLAKAELQPLDAKLENPIQPAHKVTVQFNPETLKVSFTNQVSPSGTTDSTGTAARQVVATGTTKLSLQLWFDVTAEMPPGVNKEFDVRNLTKKIAYFITPHEETNKLPPGVRFTWGSFTFDGLMESLEESLEFFSDEGIPLRASMTLNLTQQKILEFSGKAGPPPPGTGPAAGTRKLAAPPAGSTLQGLAASQGKADNWQVIAAANQIENPRLLQPGQLIDMDARLPQGSRGAGGSS